MARCVAVVLVAWGLMHAVSAMWARAMWTRDFTDTALTPGALFISAVVLVALLTVVGGAGLWSNQRWALAILAIGVAGLGLAPLVFVIHRLGFHGVRWFHVVERLAMSGLFIVVAARAAKLIPRAR
jgi:hypothetical protein